jgi:hypothetical protein
MKETVTAVGIVVGAFVAAAGIGLACIGFWFVKTTLIFLAAILL